MKLNLVTDDGRKVGTVELDLDALQPKPKALPEQPSLDGLDTGCTLADERSEEASSSRSSETLEAVSTSFGSSNSKRTVRNVSGAKETAEGPDDADVERVFREWVALFGPRSEALSPSRLRVIRKALAEATPDECIRALHGLKAYRASGHPGKTDLSTVFATYPGSSPLRERIDFWIDQAEPGTVTGTGFPSAPPAKVQAAKRDVLMAQSMEGSEMARRKGEEAEEWLRQHGIETVTRPGERPTFVPRQA
jgi:hypothetical protein